MTRYSRSVIPGRPNGENGSDMDRMVFGTKSAPAANDAEEASADISDAEVSTLVDRAVTDRRKGNRRRQSDYAPLPKNGGAYRPPTEGSKRGPLLLVGAMVIVAVFGVVVWNAYRDGVRPEDSVSAPELAAAGPFKTKPAEATESKFARPDYSATVFEQVEKPKATVQPAPEERATAAPPPAPKAVPKPAPPAATAVAAPAPAAAAPKTASPVQTAAAPAKPAPPPAKPAITPAPVPVQVAAATPSKPEAINLVPTSAPKPAAPALAGGYAPAFSAGGKYAVQVAAASSEDGAMAEWNRHAKQAPELFSSAERFIVQADVNGRTVYRVRAGSFATTADADAFCDAYKAKGGQCFRVAK